MSKEEFAHLGCDKKANYVLEADDGYSFESGWADEALADESRTIENHYKGLHGYLPDEKGYRTMFFCYGQDVAAGEIERMGIIDILPTMLSWLGIPGDPDMDGKAVEQVWKKQFN